MKVQSFIIMIFHSSTDLEEASGGVNEHKSVCAQPSEEDHCPSAEVTNLGHLRSSGSVP